MPSHGPLQRYIFQVGPAEPPEQTSNLKSEHGANVLDLLRRALRLVASQ